MIELGQLAPQIIVAIVMVGAGLIVAREVRKASGNGKLDDLSKRVEGIEDRLDGVVTDVSYIRGKLDAKAEDTGRHLAVVEPGE
jgi:hypothetical protein